jgi:hypothetical protein
MAAQAGWYPDPEGDATRLRYWDGTQWTNEYTPVPPVESAAQPSAPTPEPPASQPAQAAAPAATVTETAPQSATAATASVQTETLYPMTSTDSTLRLIAFILNIISCVVAIAAIIPLAWMIPMTVHTWGIYKGKKANTVAFGVCTLIFTNLIGGILLLCSHKDEK